MARYTWRFKRVARGGDVVPTLIDVIQAVFRDGFGSCKTWQSSSIRKRLRNTNVIGLLMDEGEHTCGYAMYTAPGLPLAGKHLLWEDAICLRKEAQGLGLSRESIRDTSRLFSGHEFGWIGGRTQNPLVILRYARLGRSFPFDTSFATPEGRRVMSFLLEHIAELREAQSLDINSGICHGVYSQGRLGDYGISLSGTERFEQRLREWGFSRAAGDAVVMISRLSRPLDSC